MWFYLHIWTFEVEGFDFTRTMVGPPLPTQLPIIVIVRLLFLFCLRNMFFVLQNSSGGASSCEALPSRFSPGCQRAAVRPRRKWSGCNWSRAAAAAAAAGALHCFLPPPTELLGVWWTLRRQRNLRLLRFPFDLPPFNRADRSDCASQRRL